ncbi:MAG: ATP-binding protein, partial [Calditrichaeota bacterium]
MPRQFKPTKSRELFVGREKELEAILTLLKKNVTKWIVQITGEGGIGKSRFLEYLIQVIRKSKDTAKWQCSKIIDFYKTSNQTPLGLLNVIVLQLGREHFRTFENERRNYDEVLKNQPDPSLQQEAFNRTTEAFFEDWHSYLNQGRHVVLFFDACEEIHVNSGWIGKVMLPRMWEILQSIQGEEWAARPKIEPFPLQFVPIFAGRKPIPVDKDLERFVLHLPLEPLSKKDFTKFFEEAGWYPGKITRKQLNELNIRCGGRPLY